MLALGRDRMFNSINWKTILYGSSMAFIDVIVLSMLKAKSLGLLDGKLIVLGAMMIYAFQPIVFLEALKGETLTVMNLVWDLTSDILVTITGTVMFSEKLSLRKWMGVGLAFISLILLSSE